MITLTGLTITESDIDTAIAKFSLAAQFNQHIKFGPIGAQAMADLLRAMKARMDSAGIQQLTVEQVLGWDKEAAA